MSDESKKLSPPYATFSTFLNFFRKLQEGGRSIPSRIDPSVFGKASGAITYSVIASLKYLKLIDEKTSAPTDSFRAFAAASDPEKKLLLGQILRQGYPSLFNGSLDLQNATAGQFDEHIRSEFDVNGSTVDKIAAFFIQAAIFANEPISQLLKARKPIGSSTSSAKSSKKRRPESEISEQGQSQVSPAALVSSKPLEYQLVDLMSDPEIDEPVQQSIWALIQYLKKKSKL